MNTINRITTAITAQDPKTKIKRFDNNSFSAEVVTVKSEADPLSEDVMKLMDMFKEIEKKEKEEEEKNKNATIDEFMENLRVHQERLNERGDAHVVENKEQEAKDIAHEEEADFRKAVSKGYIKSLKSYIVNKYDIK